MDMYQDYVITMHCEFYNKRNAPRWTGNVLKDGQQHQFDDAAGHAISVQRAACVVCWRCGQEGLFGYQIKPKPTLPVLSGHGTTSCGMSMFELSCNVCVANMIVRSTVTVGNGRVESLARAFTEEVMGEFRGTRNTR